MFQKKSRKGPYFEFDVSENPFAYIRDEADLAIFITSMEKYVAEHVDKDIQIEVMQFLWLVADYVILETEISDWSVDSMLKLLNCAYYQEDDEDFNGGDFTVLSVLMHDLDCKNKKAQRELLKKYRYFERCVYGVKGKLYKQVVDSCISVLENIPVETLLSGLLKNHPLRQANLCDKKKVYEVWFFFEHGQSGCYFKSCKNYDDKDNIFSFFLPPGCISSNAEDRKGMEELLQKNCQSLLDTILLSDSFKESAHQIRKSKDSVPKKTDTIPDSSLAAKKTERYFSDLCEEEGQAFQKVQYKEFSTAIHESGHAVSTFLFAMDCKGVTIVPDKNTYGNCGVSIKEEDMIEPDKRAIVSYSGVVATNLYFKNPLPDIIGGGTDFQHAVMYLKEDVLKQAKENGTAQKFIYMDADELGLGKRESPYVVYETTRRCEACFQKANQLMEENLDLVEALAKELMKKKNMCWEEVVALLNKVRAERASKGVNEEFELENE